MKVEDRLEQLIKSGDISSLDGSRQDGFIEGWNEAIKYRDSLDHIEGNLYTEKDMDNAYDKGFQDAIGHIKPIH